MSEFTTIRIRKENKRKLNEMGTKADTHDDILSRLIKEFERNNRRKRGKNG